jgi:hypothetical protein
MKRLRRWPECLSDKGLRRCPERAYNQKKLRRVRAELQEKWDGEVF